jgi:hypothetical protein
MDRFAAQEDTEQVLAVVARRCQALGARLIAADGLGNGSVYNNLVLTHLPHLRGLTAMIYSSVDHAPQQIAGRLWRWTIGRTPSIGMVFTRVKKRLITFPHVSQSGSFLDEISCEFAEYDPENRTIRYRHPETKPDDTLHALNYACVLARRWLDSQQRLC